MFQSVDLRFQWEMCGSSHVVKMGQFWRIRISGISRFNSICIRTGRYWRPSQVW